MKHASDGMPAACCLTSAELRERAATLLAQFRLSAFPASKWIALIAKMIVAEREVLPFLTFELVAQPNVGPVIVGVTGPAGAKEFLRTVLCKAQASI
jgi:hypothetical protein